VSLPNGMSSRQDAHGTLYSEPVQSSTASRLLHRTARVISDMLSTFREDAFESSVSHGLSFFDQFQSGRIISRMTSDTHEFSPVVLLVTDLVGHVLLVPLLVVGLLLESMQMTLILLVLTPSSSFVRSPSADFSVRIAPGESVALVGQTGAGKSTIVKLIAQFYEFRSGAIRVDGEGIRSLDLASYRRSLGVVSQTPCLLAGTVADNIRYARPELAGEENKALAARIGGGEWLDALLAGLQTDVGEGGSRRPMGRR
jgi:ABC-type multidrug transport system fused ATPase/permease subunit